MTTTLLGAATDGRPRRRRAVALLGPLAAALGALAGAAVLYAVDPNQPGHYPLCPFHALTGLDCPVCGTTRGLHDLLHGDLLAALHQNVLLAAALPMACYGFLVWTRRAWTGDPRRVLVHPTVVRVAVVVALVFWVVRNIPGVPFVGPS